jgi:lysozyme family protein
MTVPETKTPAPGVPLAMTSDAEAGPFAAEPLIEALPRPMRAAPFAAIAPEYRQCFDLCRIRPAHLADVRQRVTRLMDNASRYRPVAADTGIPWYFIGILHMLESNASFSTHLHNGDPLRARTTHVPRGRPVVGNPPFTWEASAFDALDYDGLVGLDDWNTATMLYRWERFNGMGYRAHGVFSPYLWSFSNLYDKGRFVADHLFDPDSVSKQCGAGVLLKALQDVL